MATGQANKISPRKFSEKIAFLNKKEAEGNAEFEEIIKEVQATRSQSACGDLNNSTTTIHKSNKQLARSHYQSRTNITSSDELQEVFENLIECVGQYEQELQGKQQQQRQQQQQQLQCNDLLNNNEKQVNVEEHYHSTVAPEPIVSIQTTSNIQFIKHSTSTTGPTINTTNATAPLPASYIPSFQETYVDKIDPFDSQSHYMTVCGQDNNTSQCRARVTSVGSADKKNLVQVNEPPRYSSHQGAWISSNTDMYLKPAYDKSWQKSCSDPALHVVCTPINNNHQIVSCSDNILTTGECTNPNINTKTSTNQLQFVGQLDDNTLSNILPAQNITTGVEDKYNEYTFENISSIVTNQLEDRQQAGLISASQNTESLQQTKQQTIIPTMGADYDNMQFSTLPEHYNVDNSLNVVINDVPGINICSIEDDTNQSLRSVDPACLTLNDSSTSLSNLQYNNQTFSQTGYSQKIESAPSITHSDEPQLFDKKCRSTRAGVGWSNSQQIASASSQQPTDDEFNSKINQANLCNDPSMYVPKVNNMLSTSDCGLSCYEHQCSSSNNITRSHSHDCFQKIGNNRSSCHIQNHDQPQNQMLNQYDNHINQFRLQIGHSGHCCSQSNCSMKPQYGSISPIDSSSNLTSPQSEQNSPGSSTNEYNEYLPYSSSSVAGCQIRANNGSDDGNSTILLIQNQMTESCAAPHLVVSQQPPLQYRSHDGLNQGTSYIQSLNQQQKQEHLQLGTIPTVQGTASLIGPCQSPSSSKRYNLRGAYSAPPTSRGPASKN